MVRALKGLTGVISVTVVHHFLGSDGWRFANDGDKEEKCEPEPLYGFQFLKQLYLKADPNYKARFTVPLLWDKLSETAVSNESADIIRMLNSEFNHVATNPQLDLYPSNKRDLIDSSNKWIYDDFNNGVYKAGFATNQQVYETECRKVFESLDRLEKMLADQNSTQKFLLGTDDPTEVDIRTFTTAVRFDPVYLTHFKCNLSSIGYSSRYKNIVQWMKRMYKLPGIAETIDMRHIKLHYYRSHISINPNQIVGLNNGPDLSME